MSFDLTNKNIQDTFQNLLQKTGSEGKLFDLVGNEITDLTIGGTLTAHSYITSESIVNTSSGSTAFGNSSDDTHKFIGNITASGEISASGTLTANAIVGPGTFNIVSKASNRGRIDLLSNTNAGVEQVSLLTNGNTRLGITTEGQVNVKQNLNVDSHITASGNISGSSTSTLFMGSASIGTSANTSGYNVEIHGGIHLEGDTGTSNHLKFDVNRVSNNNSEIHARGNTLFIRNDGEFGLGKIMHDANIVELEAGQIILDGAVTASGNISSSGEVVLNGDNKDLTLMKSTQQINLFGDDGIGKHFIGIASNGLKLHSHNDITYNTLNDSHIFNFGGSERAKISDFGLSVTGNITASGNISASGDGLFDSVKINSGDASNMALDFKGANPTGVYYDGTNFVWRREGSTAVSLGVNNIGFGGGGNSKISAVTNTSVTINGGGTETVFNAIGVSGSSVSTGSFANLNIVGPSRTFKTLGDNVYIQRSDGTADWSHEYGFLTNNGTDDGGFGAFGSNTATNRFYIGTNYASNYLVVGARGHSNVGNVGIGTNSPPNDKLTVAGNISGSGTGSFSDGRFSGFVGIGNGGSAIAPEALLHLQNTEDDKYLQRWTLNNIEGGIFGDASGDVLKIQVNSNDALAFTTNATERVRIAKDGGTSFTSHITASGNISASGTSHTLAGFSVLNNDATITRHLTIGGDISNVNTTHITASGNISSSGALISANSIINRIDRIDNAKTGVAFGDGINVINNSHITASGNISSSGDLSYQGATIHHVHIFTDGDTTPSVSSGTTFKTANTSGTDITGFDNGTAGQIIYIMIQDNNTDFTDGTNLQLFGGLDHDTAQVNDTISFICVDGTKWCELNRSDNT